MSNFFIYIPTKDKREHIRFLFQMICKFENIDGDEFDVYSRGGRWFDNTPACECFKEGERQNWKTKGENNGKKY